MRKLLLKCGLSLGDIVMLTASVRDLHRCYPGMFLTDVDTPFPALWENNPYVTPLAKDDPQVEQIACSYPLINRCNETPYHCLHGFIEFLNDHLGLSIKPTAFKGDLHLSDSEKKWASQVHELTGQDTPFWIIAAGGKYDITIKWWETKRYQEVGDQLRGKIQFVQVGDLGHHHPKINGAIDLRGKTDLRQLIRLVYHSQGILCSVTGLMHLCAATETKAALPPNRPCVVVAGGREPAHWEAYPDHQFIHTNGALSCCVNGGCWKDRAVRLNDGDERDRAQHLCVNIVNGLARCMAMIPSQQVVSRISTYFEGGVIRYLNHDEAEAAERGILKSKQNSYDQQPLNLHNAGMACEDFVRHIPSEPGQGDGRGIVICGGGARYYTNAWVCINMLRRLGCRLPVELWYLGRKELDDQMKSLIETLNVKCIDACEVQKKFPVRRLNGWELKPYAILHSEFQEVLLLDADNVPVVNPEFLFETKQYQHTGAIFWPDYPRKLNRQGAIWKSCGLRRGKEPEFETGQIVVDKKKCWSALCLTMWFNENSDFYYQYLHGDKETFHLAFRKLKKSYSLVRTPIHSLSSTMCQHDFEGRRIFQHRNMDKWDYLLLNRQVEDFWFERECREYIIQLQKLWDGGLATHQNRNVPTPQKKVPRTVPASMSAVMISCSEREILRRKTLDNLKKTDWGTAPIHIEIDTSSEADRNRRQLNCAFKALQKGLTLKTDFILLLEDDLDFNRHLKANLAQWKPIRTGSVIAASLYNFQARELAFDRIHNTRIIAPDSLYGSQAWLFSRKAVNHLLRNWERFDGGLEARISHLHNRENKPLHFHAPSLIQHIGMTSTRGNEFHQANDFDPNWMTKSPV